MTATGIGAIYQNGCSKRGEYRWIQSSVAERDLPNLLCLRKLRLVLQGFFQADVTMLHACLRTPLNFDLDVADSQAPSQR